MIFLHFLRSIFNFSSTLNISKYCLTVSFQAFRGPQAYHFPNTSLFSTHLSTPPSTFLLSRPYHGSNLLCLILSCRSINPHLLANSSLESLSCHVIQAIYQSLFGSLLVNMFSIFPALAHVSAPYNITNLTKL